MTTRRQRKSASLKCIGERACVAPSTVSRILTGAGKYKYADETVRRVSEAARQLGYRRSQLFRSVFTGQTQSAGVISCLGPFYAEVVQGIHDRLLESGYATVLGVNPEDYDNPRDSAEEKMIRRLNEHRVDGFILRPTRDNATDEHFREIIENRLPLITIDRRVSSDYADYVGSDNVQGGRIAAQHLAELGHRNLVQFASDLQCSSYRERAAGFESELIERGCTIQTVTFATVGELSRKCTLLFSRMIRPTAVFCSNDALAVAIYDELTRLGLKIPGDVSIVGFGNIEPSRCLRPRLTTIDQNPCRVGVVAAELFLKRRQQQVDKIHRPQSVLVDVTLVERESCGAPKAAVAEPRKGQGSRPQA